MADGPSTKADNLPRLETDNNVAEGRRLFDAFTKIRAPVARHALFDFAERIARPTMSGSRRGMDQDPRAMIDCDRARSTMRC